MVLLQINKLEFDLIKSGIKKTDWRNPSLFNKKKLFKIVESGENKGKFIGNEEIKQVTFVNGYNKDAQRLTVEVKDIKMYKFSRDVEIKEDNFKALEGQWSIAISLGNLIL